MRASHALVEAILKIPTYDAVVAALAQVMDCLRLCWGRQYGCERLCSALLLHLGRDQECYDFVKWYATTGNKSNYDWGNMDEPFLDVRDTDVLESAEYMCIKYLDLNRIVSMALLKVKSLRAVRAGSEGLEMLKSSQTFKEIEDKHKQNASGDSDHEHVEVIKVLRSHMDMLYQAIYRENTHFWGALINPGRNVEIRPEFYCKGSTQEMQMVLQKYYNACKETPGAIEVTKAISRKEDY